MNGDGENGQRPEVGEGSGGHEGSGPQEGSRPQEGSGVDEGPGWMPAILAATALMGIAGFVFCGFSTWVLFQKRTEFAIRTVRDAYIPEIEQSLLRPEQKSAVLKDVSRLADEMQRGNYENWQSAGILQRLQRLPVIQWGELDAIESFTAENASPEVAAETAKQFSRLRRAVEVGRATSFDFEDVLRPVHVNDTSLPSGHRLQRPLELDAIDEVVGRSRLVADRERVPDEVFDDVRIDAIVKAQIDAGTADGGF